MLVEICLVFYAPLVDLGILVPQACVFSTSHAVRAPEGGEWETTVSADHAKNKITINSMDIYKKCATNCQLLHCGRAHASSQQNSVLCHQSARTASLTVHSHVTLPFIQLGFLCTISWFGYSGSSQS
jgi:hypothetical protein